MKPAHILSVAVFTLVAAVGLLATQPITAEPLDAPLDPQLFFDNGNKDNDKKNDKDNTQKSKKDQGKNDPKSKGNDKHDPKKKDDDKNDPKSKGNDKHDPKKKDDDKNDPKSKGNDKHDPKKKDDDKNDPKSKGNDKHDPKKKDDDKNDPKVGGLQEIKIKVGGKTREALIAAPASALKTASPVIFVFHGHGENMRIAANRFGCHETWPEAICVYMQGLPTKTNSDPKGQDPGWQNSPGVEGGRDLQFFDRTLAQLRDDYKVDAGRVFATGFSNGGNFTYVLWASRGKQLRAVAPCGSVSGALKNLPPKPCLHIGGRKDDIVRFEKQERTMEFVRKENKCAAKGQPWGKDGAFDCTLYPSSAGAPFVSAIHNQGHVIPNGAGRLIVQFFRQN